VSNTGGGHNIAIGDGAGGSATSGDYNIYIGNVGVVSEGSTLRIGDTNQLKTFISGVRGGTTFHNDAIAVLVDSAGQLGTVSSSREVKEDIVDMNDASERVMKLRPVTFRYRKPFADGSKPVQFGLIAEEVAETFPELAVRSSDGKIETVKYHLIPVLLLNELQRQQQEIRELRQQIEELRSAVTRIQSATILASAK
jgi:Chaperone of endosialidase